MDLKEESILGAQIADHWYYTSKAAALEATLAEVPAVTAIDIGSGSGFFARHLLAHSGLRQVDCVDTAYDADADETLDGGKVVRRRRQLDAAADQADLVLLMDVLEHVDDDAALLRAAADHLAPGGRVLITVPAFGWLWSGHDEFLEHRRRYTLSQVEALLERCGLVVERGHYVFGLVFPAAVLQRLADRLRPGPAGSRLTNHRPIVNRTLGALCRAEVHVQRWNRLAGLSVMVTGRRPMQ
jgi:2-polyprenyl-3-methyl-5-hydroxy-6-metoxy-1,4-benzoquinol methylase